ncbi:MAG: selenide, water dikinase SelD [Alphaproteobacteria bacterium]
MRKPDVPVLKDLVLVGGGHAHVAVLRRFGMRPLPGVRITVICREVHTPYSGMLPGMIAGHYGFDDAHIDLGPLCRFAGARLYRDEAVGLDRAAGRVLCADRPPVRYDLVSLDIGSTPDLGVPGAAQHAIPVKPIGRFLEKWEGLVARVLASAGPFRVAVVGGGAGGVELLLSVHHRLRALLAGQGDDPDRLGFALFAGPGGIMPTHPAGARRRLGRILATRGVAVYDSAVTAVAADTVTTDDGTAHPVDAALWVTAAAAAPWLRETGLALDERGFVQVDETLRSLGDGHVFAVGDIAAMVAHPRPKSGVFAVRQGRPLADNLRRAFEGRALRRFRPQRAFLGIVGTGDRNAVASRAGWWGPDWLSGGWSAEGGWVWHWKDRIDRRFMRHFADLPAMEQPEPPVPAVADAAARSMLAEAAMRCGGCGAKVGAGLLARTLAGLRPVMRDDVLVGLDAPDDAAVISVPPGKVLVQTVDHFRAILDDPYLFGRIAANHALGDVYAMGAEPQSALAIVTVPYGPEVLVEEQLFQLMSGAARTLEDAGCTLAGGHTGEGAELALGFAVNGLADPARLMRKSGLRPGDALILTKPLGTGTLFAAEMRGKAKRRWIEAAIAAMLQSNREAAAILQAHGATACTDVTGFGLLGHLLEMTEASGVGATLRLDALPVLEGAEETAGQGLLSSLHAANARAESGIANLDTARRHPRYPLLFDPQTAGGLLAGVPAGRVEACVEALSRAGCGDARVVGEVRRDGPGVLEIA